MGLDPRDLEITDFDKGTYGKSSQIVVAHAMMIFRAMKELLWHFPLAGFFGHTVAVDEVLETSLVRPLKVMYIQEPYL